MVVIEFDLPRSVSLSALDDNNVTLKDAPENTGQESNKMVPRATLICRPNSHPFQERYLTLESAAKVGRSVARVKPALNNAIFDCKVLSRNHALLWYKDGKFYLQDTKSSNGTFVNNQRLSKGSEESAPREVCSGDIVQFGVDVMENSRKVTHGCIVATLKLYLPDGKEAKASPSTGIQDEEEISELCKQDLYQLNQWIQEAVIREQVLETKLGTLQRIVGATREAAELGWTALMEEDRLLTRIESLENQLIICSKNFNEDKLREEIRKLYDEKNVYQDVAKESLRKVLTDKMETLKKLQEAERSLSNAEDERDNLKELNDKLKQQMLELADKFQKESDELQECKLKLQEADNLQQRLEQEILIRQEVFREAKARETVLLAQVESRQAEVDFTKEQLANLRLRLESAKSSSVDGTKNECDVDNEGDNNVDDVEKQKKTDDVEDQTESLKQRVAQLESQLEAAKKINLNGEHIEDPIGLNINEIKRLQELLDESRHKSQLLEMEVERRQMEAQDGWAAAARLQQYFRNLHNVLKDSKLAEEDDDDDDNEVDDSGEASELAGNISAKILLIKNDYEDLLAINAKQSDNNRQLAKRLEYYEHELKLRKAPTPVPDQTPQIECLQREVDALNQQLRELEVSRRELSDDGQKWQQAYQTLLLSNENRDSGIVSQLGSSPTSSRMSSRDPDVRSVDSSGVRDSSILDDSVPDDLPDQLADVRSELESLKQQFDAIQKEKKSLETEFDELKENYSLLSSQSKTVTALCMMPLLVLFISFVMAFYRFFSRLTATVDPS